MNSEVLGSEVVLWEVIILGSDDGSVLISNFSPCSECRVLSSGQFPVV